MTAVEFIGKLNPALFWDYDANKLHPIKNKVLIFERVFTRGSLEEYRLLLSFYKENDLKEGIVNIPQLDPITLNFLSVVFDIPKPEFKCYGKKQWME